MLLDSNIVIYSAEPEYAGLLRYIRLEPRVVSIASYIEVLGFHALDEYHKRFFEDFFQSVQMLPLTPEIADRAVELRQQRSMGLGDAIIAATALEHSITLITRNTHDFRRIANLDLHNPIPDYSTPDNTDN